VLKAFDRKPRFEEACGFVHLIDGDHEIEIEAD
jgi:hypothetical protein